MRRFDGCVRWQPLDHVNVGITEMRDETFVLIQPNHGIFGQQIGLDRNRIRCRCKLCPRQQPSGRTARAICLDNLECRICRIHRCRDLGIIVSSNRRWNEHKNQNTQQQRYRIPASATTQIALDRSDFGFSCIRHRWHRLGRHLGR